MNYNNNITKNDLSFGLSLMSHLGEGNISVSPMSIRTALAMLYEGARGDTAKQLAQNAYIPEDDFKRAAGFKEIMNSMNSNNPKYILKCANGLWADNNYPLRQAYQFFLTDIYSAQAQSANFKDNADGERAKINEWVSEKTNQKIPELFPKDTLDSSTILVLANALYFKASWENKFDTQNTIKQDYTLSNGEIVKVDMMRKGAVEKKALPKFLYGQYDGAKVALIPYEGKQISKMMILPPIGSSVSDLEEYLKTYHISVGELYSTLRSEKFIRLEIPRHELRGNYTLNEPLKAMGMKNMFSLQTAELSGIGPDRLAVSTCIHKTYFKTNEEGSEGAAATGVGVMRGVSIDHSLPVEFVADRPFLEAIIDNNTGSLLFLNKVEDPR